MKTLSFSFLLSLLFTSYSHAILVCEPVSSRSILGGLTYYSIYITNEGTFKTDWDDIFGTGDSETHKNVWRNELQNSFTLKNKDNEFFEISKQEVPCVKNGFRFVEPKQLCLNGYVRNLIPTHIDGFLSAKGISTLTIECKIFKLPKSISQYESKRFN